MTVPVLTAWATALIETVQPDISSGDLDLLRRQAASLTVTEETETAAPSTGVAIVTSIDQLDSLARTLDTQGEVAIDLETSSLNPRAGVIVGIGLAIDNGEFYLPVNHRTEGDNALRPNQLPLLDIVNRLRLHERPLVAHNAKFEFRWLRCHAGIRCRFKWDTMLAARLLRSDQSADLEELAVRELDVPTWSLSKADMARMQLLPIDQVAAYCALDCKYSLQIYRRQRPCLNSATSS